MEPGSTRPPCHALSRPSASRGLTLVELLLVLVLLGILAAIALPSFGTDSGSHRAVRLAREVHGALAQGRARAVAEQRAQRFVVSADGRYRLESRDGTGSWITYLTSLPPGASIRVVGGSSGAVVFEPDGRVRAPATVRIGDPPHQHGIRVLAGGLVRWSGPSP